jgi:hypothetical protein
MVSLAAPPKSALYAGRVRYIFAQYPFMTYRGEPFRPGNLSGPRDSVELIRQL